MRFQKTYLNRSMTRAMAMDHPIGDPFGGPAYGERRDPVSAVIAVASMYGSYAGAAALVGGAISLGTIAAGVVFASGALSLVGNATGNKDLMKVGQVGMLVGGIGGFMDPSGFMGNATTVDLANETGNVTSISDSSTVASDVATPNTNVADVSSSVTADVPTVEVGGPNPTSNTVVNQSVNTPMAPTDASLQTSGQLPTSSNNVLDVNATAPPPVAAPSAPAAAPAPTSANSFDSFGNSTPVGSPSYVSADPTGMAQLQLEANATANAANAANGGGGLINSAVTGFNNLDTMGKILATKVGADVVGGIASYVSPSPQQKAQTEYANAAAKNADASADANAANAAKIRQEQALQQARIDQLNKNMQMGLGIGINPNAVQIAGPAQTNYQIPGLIQQARAA